MIRVTIYNEFTHERSDENVAKLYPNGIHGTLKAFLENDEVQVRCFTLDTVEEITPEVLKETDVMLWWGHVSHRQVPDSVAAAVRDAVLSGMGMIFLHSAHESKPFMLLMGTGCHVNWREDGDMERLWTVMPSHPIAQGVDPCVILPNEETYGEPFGIPQPDELIFIGWYDGGEVFRSGCTFRRGNGKIFYLQPGHETFPIYYDPNIQRIITNAVQWAKPDFRSDGCLSSHHCERPNGKRD